MVHFSMNTWGLFQKFFCFGGLRINEAILSQFENHKTELKKTIPPKTQRAELNKFVSVHC